MKRRLTLVVALFAWVFTYANTDITSVISDIFNQLNEDATVDYQDLADDLLELSEHPINLNAATAEQLHRLYFLSDRQIDDILLYCYEHPMDSLYELQLIHSLHDYDIRNLLAFVYVQPIDSQETIYPKQILHNAHHELISRLDIRNAEAAPTDPVYLQQKYRFNYQHRILFGLQMTRPTGADPSQLQWGGYFQLNQIGCLQTLVAGDFQASFGQGLVLSNPFHQSKSSLAMNAATQPQGLRKYSATSERALHGVGTTFAWQHKHVSWQTSALYSCTKPNDTLFQHVLGANLQLQFRQFHMGVTAIEYLFSDSLHYYRNAAYNQRYFRGKRQLVMGANWRYVYQWLDFFGEVAVAQNRQWGVALQTGARLSPHDNWGIILLYRYYSPWFDNQLGYAFAENSRIQDENGAYIGLECTQVPHLKINLWGDLFHFKYPKYGIPSAPTLGYDAMLDMLYTPLSHSQFELRLRARQKTEMAKYSLLLQYDWRNGAWHLRSRVDATLCHQPTDYPACGINILQDIEYRFPNIPLVLQLRLQGFDIRQWDNRIYCYENDVLYAYSIPATYGIGGRAYLNARYKINPWLSVYLRISETVWNRDWAILQGKYYQNQTDIHLLLRATF